MCDLKVSNFAELSAYLRRPSVKLDLRHPDLFWPERIRHPTTPSIRELNATLSLNPPLFSALDDGAVADYESILYLTSHTYQLVRNPNLCGYQMIVVSLSLKNILL